MPLHLGLLALALLQAPPIQSHLREDALLSQRARSAVEETLAKYMGSKVGADELACTLVEIRPEDKSLKFGHFRGDEPFYPASVVKLFYLVFAHQRMEEKKLGLTPEFQRGLSDMIRDSSNDATGYVFDVLTGVTGGPELGPAALENWLTKRQIVNRWFELKGYSGINVNQKTWGDGPYGRERQSYGPNFERRNKLTSNATARLMSEIATGQIVTPTRCQLMLGLLERKISVDSKEADSQSREFTGDALPSGSKLYSKAGWTSTTKHDVAYVVLPNGAQVVVSVFTKGHSNEVNLLPFLAGKLLAPYLAASNASRVRPTL